MQPRLYLVPVRPDVSLTRLSPIVQQFCPLAPSQIVNVPEVLSKFDGETEKNARDSFANAQQDQRTRGDQSDLPDIISDKIDEICKSRGSTSDGTGVHDSIVNQLLTKIDGVESMNNFLPIGMTNRKDLLDKAILRPGHLEVQGEISLLMRMAVYRFFKFIHIR